MFDELLTKLRFLIHRKSRDEVDEELRSHLEHEVNANVDAGMTQLEARRQAVIAFSGIERAREECRQQLPGYWMETLLQDVRYALRGFRQNPAFALAVVLTLMLGIGATTAVFSVVDRILFRSLPYAHDDQLVSVGLVQPMERQEFTLGGFFFDWQHNQKPFESMTFEHGVDACNLTEASPVHLTCAFVAQNFLPTLGILPVVGRNFSPEDDTPNGPKVALISNQLWLSRFNRDPEVVDKTLSIDGHSTRIIGVLPKDFEMPRLQAADIVVPARLTEADAHKVNSGLGWPMWAFARLKPGVSVEQAKEQMQPLFLQTQQWIPAAFRKEFRAQVRSIRDRQMQEAYAAAWVLLGSVFAVLLIACANVASLFSARGAARERELAVRSALGASRGRLIRQTLTEALLLAFAGAAAGCVLAEVLLRVFIVIAPSGLPFLEKADLDLRIVLFTATLALVCAAVFGVAPALQRPNVTMLTTKQGKARVHARVRGLLVAAQIGISVVLLSGASLLLESFRNLESQNLGMETRNVLTVHIPLNGERYPNGFQDIDLRLEAAFRQIPGVSAVGMSNSTPPDGWHGDMRYAEIYVTGRPHPPPGIGGSVVVRAITPDYFRVLRIPVLEGAGFTEEERQSSGDFIVLSKLLAARLFPQGGAIGQHIQLGTYAPYLTNNGPIYTVVGVAADVKNAGLAGQQDPEFYTLRTNRHPESWDNHHIFLIETQLPVPVISQWIHSEAARLDPTAPVEVSSLNQDVSRLADRPRFETALVGFFAACGVLLAIVGLYGVIAYVTTQRTHEIGVRMAIGATRMNVFWLIALDGVRLVALGGVVGLVAALLTAQSLKSMMFQVGPRDPLTYALVVASLAFVALAATVIPSYRAMKVDPAVALRYE